MSGPAGGPAPGPGLRRGRGGLPGVDFNSENVQAGVRVHAAAAVGGDRRQRRAGGGGGGGGGGLSRRRWAVPSMTRMVCLAVQCRRAMYSGRAYPL